MKNLIRNIIVVAAAVSIAPPVALAQQELSLQEAVNLAISNNPEIAARSLEVEKAAELRVVSRSLFLPSVHLAAQANHYFKLNPFFGFGESGPTEKIPYGRFGGEDQFGTFVSASQPLFNPVASPSSQLARLQEEESKLDLESAKNSLEASVKQTYLQILVLKERIKLQQESIRRNSRALQDAKSLFLQGRGLRVDTLRAYTAVKNLEPDLLKLTAAVKTSTIQLANLLGVKNDGELVLTDSLVLPDPGSIPTEEQVYAAARNSNPIYRNIVLQEELNKQEIKIASSARLPQLSAVAQYGLQSQTNNFDYADAYYPSSSFVGLQLSVPLFTGFSNQAKTRQARLSREQTTLRSGYAFEELRASAHQVVSDSHESLARLKTASDVQETARLSYSITEYRYKKGIASRLELTDAELDLSTAQSNYLEAIYDYLSARIALRELMGTSADR